MTIIESAINYKWSSVTEDLNPKRLEYLENLIIGKHILDAGCGGGGYVRYLENMGYTVYGIDNSLDLLHFSQQKRKGTYIQGQIENLPFADKSFDTTYCFDVLEHIDDVLGLLELARVTRKRIIFSVPYEDNIFHKYGLIPYAYQDKTHLRYYTTERIYKLTSLFTHKKIEILYENIFPIGNFIEEISINNQQITEILYYSLKSIDNFRCNPFYFSKKLNLFIINIFFSKNKLKRFIKNYLTTDENFRKIPASLLAVVDI